MKKIIATLAAVLMIGATSLSAFEAISPAARPEEDEDKEYGPTVQEIQKMYPELSLNFINNTFEQNDKFNEEYVGNVKVEHHISFQDESDLNIFIDVCKDNKYEVEKDGTSVKVISKFTNEKGSIMSDIFNVANQSLLLNGQYLGYNIEVEK